MVRPVGSGLLFGTFTAADFTPIPRQSKAPTVQLGLSPSALEFGRDRRMIVIKVYTYYQANSMREGVLSKGSVNGKVWTWTSEAKMGGKPTKSRFTLTEDTADSQSYKFEMSMGEGPTQLVMEGKSTRVPNPPKKK